MFVMSTSSLSSCLSDGLGGHRIQRHHRKWKMLPLPQRVDITIVELILDPSNPEGVKPCCACLVTKRKRDDCFMNSSNGEVECKDLVQAHRE